MVDYEAETRSLSNLIYAHFEASSSLFALVGSFGGDNAVALTHSQRAERAKKRFLIYGNRFPWWKVGCLGTQSHSHDEFICLRISFLHEDAVESKLGDNCKPLMALEFMFLTWKFSRFKIIFNGTALVAIKATFESWGHMRNVVKKRDGDRRCSMRTTGP